jgi:hypothetical protein
MKVSTRLRKVKVSPKQSIYMHTRRDCDGPCPVHSPSNHHMRGFLLFWRDDRKIFERICSHGVGHPDPDMLAFLLETGGSKVMQRESIHGCDGCCHVGVAK